jgi:hypothetical protein
MHAYIQICAGLSAALCTSNKYVHTEIPIKTMKNVWQAICYTTGTYYFIKVEVAPVHDLKAYRGGVGIATTILNVGTRWRCVVSLTLQHLRLRQTGLRYPLNKKTDGLQEPVWTFCSASVIKLMLMGESQSSMD